MWSLIKRKKGFEDKQTKFDFLVETLNKAQVGALRLQRLGPKDIPPCNVKAEIKDIIGIYKCAINKIRREQRYNYLDKNYTTNLKTLLGNLQKGIMLSHDYNKRNNTEPFQTEWDDTCKQIQKQVDELLEYLI